MERLTVRLPNGNTNIVKSAEIMCFGNVERTLGEVIERLAQYEDLGVTPEQIREIDRNYREKCEEVAELEKSSLDAIEMCKNVGGGKIHG